MTQKFHWFAALALFLAFAVGAVRAADEQQEVAPPARKCVEVLPAPMKAAACCSECGSSCKCCSKCCNHAATEVDPKQYSVTTKFVNASPDGDCDEMLSPKFMVLEGQTANLLVQGEETPSERHALGMQIRVTNQDKRVHLDLGVQNHQEWKHATGSQASMMTSACHMGCDVTLEKMKRLVLTRNANGSDASWVEVTVNEVAAADDEDGSALDYVGEVVDDLIDAVSDVATTLFGDDDAAVEQAAFPTPTPMVAAPLAFPVQTVAPCPMCKQCVAVEAVKKPVRQKCVEFRDGDKGWKATADRMTLRGGYILMEGHVQVVSSDGADEMTSEKLTLKMANLEIQIGD